MQFSCLAFYENNGPLYSVDFLAFIIGIVVVGEVIALIALYYFNR